MPTLPVPNATLSYTLSGHGPLLLLIPGANGEPSIFTPLTHLLTPHFTVLSFARRGYSASTYTSTPSASDLSPLARLHTDADDAAALITHVSSSLTPGTVPVPPAFVFGTSSGAIVALALLIRYPHLIRFLIAHEPPLTKLLPANEAAAVYAGYESIAATYRARGVGPAVEQFVAALVGSAGKDSLEGRIAAGMGREENEGNARWFFEWELLAYTGAEMDLGALRRELGQGRWMAGWGRETGVGVFGRVVERLGEEMQGVGVRLRVEGVPGGHLGYVSRVEEFAGWLRGVLLDVGERGRL